MGSQVEIIDFRKDGILWERGEWSLQGEEEKTYQRRRAARRCVAQVIGCCAQRAKERGPIRLLRLHRLRRQLHR